MKKILFYFTLILLIFLFTWNLDIANASRFTEAQIRLDRTKPNTALSGTICVKPSSAGAGTENKINIEFPSDFTINSTTSNWNTNITDLPEGSSAWPGISANASSVTGKTVTFASSDLLSSSTLYCFNFESLTSSTGNTGKKIGTITTKNSANTTIDENEYGLSIITNDQIVVSATVPANATDYTIHTTRVNPPMESTILSENLETLYKIFYSSILSYPTSISVQATWSQGTIENQSSPTVELLEYIVGSASNGYNSAPPVIDTVNRTITWTINSFPGNSAVNAVTFKLKTLSNYSEQKNVNYSVSSRIFFPGGVTNYATLVSTFKHSTPVSVNISPTPTPLPIPLPPKIEKLGVNLISQDSATIYVWTDSRTSKTIIYGTDIHIRDKKTIQAPLSKGANLKIDKLSPSTKYYYKVYVTDASGKQTSSDVYTFTTADPSTPLLANPFTLVVTSNNTILTGLGERKNDILVIPINSSFQFKFAMLNKISANTVRADLRNKNILGLTSFLDSQEISADSTNLIETEKGVYSGSLKTGLKPGIYSLVVKVHDENGNISEQNLTEIKTINKFTVLSNSNKNPIEGVRVLLSIYNPTSKTYQVIPSSILSSGNPQLTDANGQLNLVLPQGKYKAEISDLRHKSKTVDFEIGVDKNHGFPIIELEKTGVSPFNVIDYYRRSISDVFIYNTKEYSLALTGSTRFFDLVSLISLGAVIILTIYAFSKRHRIPVSYIPSYFYYLVDRKDRNNKYIHGVIYDEDNLPIHSANVYLTNKEDEKIISSTKTNKYGEFFFRKKQNMSTNNTNFLLMAMAKGYKTSPVFAYHEREHLKFKINLTKETEGLNLMRRSVHLFEHVIGMSFEVLLIGSFIFELLFINSFGLGKTLPFLVITLFNLTLWILHQHNRTHSKNVF